MNDLMGGKELLEMDYSWRCAGLTRLVMTPLSVTLPSHIVHSSSLTPTRLEETPPKAFTTTHNKPMFLPLSLPGLLLSTDRR